MFLSCVQGLSDNFYSFFNLSFPPKILELTRTSGLGLSVKFNGCLYSVYFVWRLQANMRAFRCLCFFHFLFPFIPLFFVLSLFLPFSSLSFLFPFPVLSLSLSLSFPFPFLSLSLLFLSLSVLFPFPFLSLSFSFPFLFFLILFYISEFNVFELRTRAKW